MQSSSRGARAAQTPSGALKLLRIALVALPLFALFAPKQAHAYAWMIKRGYPSCPACHADPSGGELLTAYGRMISTLTLSTNWGGDESAANQHGLQRKIAMSSPSALERRLAMRTPESFAAGPKAAGPEGDKPADKAGAADGDKAKADADTDEDEDKAEGDKPEGDKAEGEAAASTEAAPEAAPAASSSSSDSGESTFPNFLFGAFDLPDWLLLGGSYRHLNILPVGGRSFKTFPMMADLYGMAQFGGLKIGASIGAARVDAGSPYARRAQVTGGQGNQWNLISRTHYIGYDILPELTVRVGRLNLPFGVRIPEHTMWARQATMTDRESSQQHGLALAYVGESLRGEIMAIAGNYQVKPDKFRERGYSGYAEYQINSTATLGVSSLMTVSKTDPFTRAEGSSTRQVHGAMARVGFGEKVALLTEFDGMFTSRREAGYVGFLQVDTEAVQGVHLLLTGEMLDQGHPKDPTIARTAGEGKPKVGGWVSLAWFVYSHFDVRVDLIKRTGEDPWLLGQVHVYL